MEIKFHYLSEIEISGVGNLPSRSRQCLVEFTKTQFITATFLCKLSSSLPILDAFISVRNFWLLLYMPG